MLSRICNRKTNAKLALTLSAPTKAIDVSGCGRALVKGLRNEGRYGQSESGSGGV